MFWQLVDRADALIEGFRPGVLGRLGFGWDALHQRNPRLVLCSLSGYGQTGPLSQRAGHDLNYIAMTGVLDQIRADGKLAIPNMQIGDLLGGTLTALATMVIALLGAQRTGQGSHVDVAMTDGLLAHHVFPHASVDSGVMPIAEQTLLTGGVACYQIYETADGQALAVGALELKFWQAFCDAVGLSELRTRHWELGEAPGSPAALETIDLAAQRISRHSLQHWLAIFETVDACVTPVLTPAEALAHPHHLARNLVHKERGVTEVGPLATIAPLTWSSRSAPAAGAHTRALLNELGYGSEQVERMIDSRRRQRFRLASGEGRMTQLGAVTERHGFDQHKLAAYLVNTLPGFQGPLEVQQFQGRAVESDLSAENSERELRDAEQARSGGEAAAFRARDRARVSRDERSSVTCDTGAAHVASGRGRIGDRPRVLRDGACRRPDLLGTVASREHARRAHRDL